MPFALFYTYLAHNNYNVISLVILLLNTIYGIILLYYVLLYDTGIFYGAGISYDTDIFYDTGIFCDTDPHTITLYNTIIIFDILSEYRVFFLNPEYSPVGLLEFSSPSEK